MTIEVTGETAGYSLAGLTALAMLGRATLSWFKGKGLTDAKTDANRDVIETLREEAKRWEDRYNLEVKEHAENRELLQATREQNRLLRAILLHHGMSKEELDLLIKESANS